MFCAPAFLPPGEVVREDNPNKFLDYFEGTCIGTFRYNGDDGGIQYFPLACGICLTEGTKNFQGQTAVLKVSTEAFKGICRHATQSLIKFSKF